MITQQHRNSFGQTITLRSHNFLLLFFVSAAALAAANGALHLPESYRTPLTDMAFDNNREWRAQPKEDNPWRGGEDELTIKPRLKAEFFPKYDYNTVDNPNTRSLLQNENELERPRTNIFKYTF